MIALEVATFAPLYMLQLVLIRDFASGILQLTIYLE